MYWEPDSCKEVYSWAKSMGSPCVSHEIHHFQGSFSVSHVCLCIFETHSCVHWWFGNETSSFVSTWQAKQLIVTGKATGGEVGLKVVDLWTYGNGLRLTAIKSCSKWNRNCLWRLYRWCFHCPAQLDRILMFRVGWLDDYPTGSGCSCTRTMPKPSEQVSLFLHSRACSF